jgi:hypothetical protein
MTDQLVIEDLNLADQIQRIAQQENRSVEAVLSSMVAQYRPQPVVDNLPSPEEMGRQVRLAAYKEAREYWARVGNTERAAMTDEQLDEEFWLIDTDGIPRLKSEKGDVQLPKSSLHRGGQILASAGFRSGHSDISARAREIMEGEFTDYLLSRMNQDDNDDDSSTG